jgi:NTP pyrophosphatase (non-canonical NTP hydrolase)
LFDRYVIPPADWLTFARYQEMAQKTAFYYPATSGIYALIGLIGEVGEFSGKVKKIMRGDTPDQTLDNISEATRHELIKELGDVLWYLSEISRWLGVGLGEVAQGNLQKLALRQERGTIKGDGDDR